jgi:predicted O-methyltransferase YrrM
MKNILQSMFRGMTGDAATCGSDMRGHMAMLYLLARHWSSGLTVELGVGRGFSTMSLLAGVAEAGRKLDSYDIDPDAKGRALKYMALPEGDPILGAWTFHHGWSVPAAGDFKDQTISLMFLDTSHRLDDVRKELAAWEPKMLPDGVICGHDYFLHEDPEWREMSGVKTAVDEFAEMHKSRFHLQVFPHDRGFFILWPRSFWDAS